MALTATTGGGTQTSTQSPQSSAGAAGFGTNQQSGSVQPGTTASLLTSTGGVPLQNTQLSTVDLTSSSQAKTAPTTTTTHHVNPGLIALPVILLFIAAVLIWSINRSAKTTTNY
jgi:hypothetical protein